MGYRRGTPVRYVRNPAARLKQVGRESAVWVPETRAVHVLNGTARLLFECLAEPVALEELVAVFAERTDAEPRRLEADLGETLERFTELGIVRAAE